MPDPTFASFPFFPQLSTELRLLIWEFHFSLPPRIHVLHSTETIGSGSTAIHLTCTTLDSQTNSLAPGCLRTDINSEARRVARKVMSHERVTDLARPMSIPHALDPRRRDASPVASSWMRAVDIDWANDLIYLCTPDSFIPFVSLCKRPWSRKIENLALAQPWLCSTPPVPGRDMGYRQVSFDGELLRIAVRNLGPRLRNLLVVLVPPPEAPGAGHEPSGGESPSQLPLDQYGFAPMAQYLQEPGKKRGLSTAVDTSRVAMALEKQLRIAGQGRENAVIRKCVDVDLVRLEDGHYSRRPRRVDLRGGSR